MASTTSPLLSPLRDPLLLIGRVVLGIIFMAHGWQKIAQDGLEATTQGFVGMGVPLAEVAAPVVAVAELLGGALLILGLFTGIAGIVLAIDMAVAAILVHLSAGVFVAEGGWELVGALGAAALVLSAVGPGRLALDRLVGGSKRSSRRRSTSSSSASVSP
ncbi:DoxX family protein [Brachybacterium tyrofermentans]|uniref:DoxX family protein n=1 Tax=Brachybacterium tyrofermentans TaxID=47848 RepID=UPI003FCFACB6